MSSPLKSTLHTTDRRRGGFTVLELVIGIVVVSLLALLLVPLVRSTIGRTTDAANEASLAAVMRAAGGDVLVEGDVVWNLAAFQRAIEADIAVGNAGEGPDGGWVFLVDEPGSLRWSARYGEVHVALSEDRTEAGLAMESRDGLSCAFASSSVGATATWTVEGDLQAACSARFALGEWAGGNQTPAPIPPGEVGSPLTPTVTATGGDRTIEVSWSAVDDSAVPVDSYQAFVRVDAALVPIDGAQVHVRDATYSVTTGATLTNGTTYTVSVVATNTNGETVGVAEATPLDTTAPGVPVPVGTLETNGAAVDAVVTWSPVAGDDLVGYYVSVDGVSAGTVNASDQLVWRVEDLDPGETVVVVVRSFDDESPANVSSPGAVTVTRAPTAPTVTAVATATDTIEVSWSAVAGADSYAIHADGAVDPTATVTATTWTHTGLSPASSHTYEVYTVNAGGSSTAGTASATTPPAAPTVTLTVLSSTSIRVAWSAVAGADSYRVERGDGTLLSTAASGAGTYDHTGLTAGSTYTYRVVAVGTGGSSASATQSATTIPAAPVVATNCPTSGSTVTGNCTPSWTAMSGATSYSVTSFGVNVANYTTSSTTGTTLTPSIGSASVGSVVVAVSACNSSGCSSSSIATTSGAPAPTVPTASWSAEAYGYRTATVSGSFAYSYELEFWHNGGTVWCSTTANGTDPSGVAYPVGCTDGAGNWSSRYLGYGTHRVLLHAYAQRDTGGTFGGARTITVAGLATPIFGSRYAISAYGINPYHPTGWSSYTVQAAAP